ncbi:ATP-binding protein [Thermophagus sp. OGC60D27]|uniref:ATP-binding protein n=1 Tax=Thermophagus sp. OGC60D27 TaxID=3458415 RepID=UPI0040384C0F
MLIKPYIEKEYPKTAPFKGVNEIEEELITQRFFIVMEETDKYMGMLTVPDVLARKKKLVADCLLPKPSLSPDSTIDQALNLLSATNLPALPVVDQNQKFYGVLLQDKLIETFNEIQNNKKTVTEENSSHERIKQEFIKNISHEIRTPLNAIQGLSEILIYSDLSNEDKNNFASLLHAKTDELLHLVDSLIHLSRIEAGGLPVEMHQMINPTILCHELMNEAKKIQNNYQKRHILLSHKMNLPKNHHFEFNASYLKEVMIHLLNNAIKFTDKGAVEFGCFMDQNSQTTFYVKDTGIGISPEKQKIIFNAFEKISPSQTKFYPGIGVGLTIASKIIELAGGKIWFESEFNKGTCFYFNL